MRVRILSLQLLQPLPDFHRLLTPVIEYLRGAEKDNKECAELFKDYQKCLNVSCAASSSILPFHHLWSGLTDLSHYQVALKQRGIDKLLEEAREDNKENDVRLLSPKSECTTWKRRSSGVY